MRVHEGFLVVQKGDSHDAFVNRLMAECALDFPGHSATFSYLLANNKITQVTLRRNRLPELMMPPHNSMYLPTHAPVISIETDECQLFLSGNKADIEVWYLKLFQCCESTRNLSEEDDADVDLDEDNDDLHQQQTHSNNTLQQAPPLPESAFKTCNGWLHKIGGVRRNWKKRWFELNEMGFTYQEKEGGKILGNIGTLSNGTIVQWNTEVVKKDLRYYLHVIVPGRIYQLYATESTDFVRWMAAFKAMGCVVSEKEMEKRTRSESLSSTKKLTKFKRGSSKDSIESDFSDSMSAEMPLSAFFPRASDETEQAIGRLRSGSLNDILRDVGVSAPPLISQTAKRESAKSLTLPDEPQPRLRSNSANSRKNPRPKSWMRSGSNLAVDSSQTTPFLDEAKAGGDTSVLSPPSGFKTLPRSLLSMASSPLMGRKAKRRVKQIRPDEVKGQCDFSSFEDFHQYLCPRFWAGQQLALVRGSATISMPHRYVNAPESEA